MKQVALKNNLNTSSTNYLDYDVVIMGGGLSGSCIALQLKKRIPHYKILLISKSEYPTPLGMGAVGESTVELASYYFSEILGLHEHLESKQLPKLGLRYFLESKNTEKIENRLEVGGNSFAPTKSYQIDRANLENEIIAKFIELGGELMHSSKITSVDLSESSKVIAFQKEGVLFQARTSLLVDASGRSGILRKKFKIKKKLDHTGSASWWRLKGEYKIDTWCEDHHWRCRNGEANARWFSTNHLMGRGYWVWLIPLSCNVTSFGVVFDSMIHPYENLNTYEKTLAWLKAHEPQLASLCEKNKDNFQDFGTLKNYSYTSSKFFSGDGWYLTGEAGAFVDPLYSPGSDFIAIANTYITDLIYRKSIGESITLRTDIYNSLYSRFINSTLNTFKGQYHILGNPEVLPVKIFWDWCFYWNFLARLFFENKICDLSFLQNNMNLFSELEEMGEEMQKLFSRWSRDSRPNAKAGFFDLSRHSYLFELNKSLSDLSEARTSQEKFTKGVEDLRNISLEIKKIAAKFHNLEFDYQDIPAKPILSEFYKDLQQYLA